MSTGRLGHGTNLYDKVSLVGAFSENGKKSKEWTVILNEVAIHFEKNDNVLIATVATFLLLGATLLDSMNFRFDVSKHLILLIQIPFNELIINKLTLGNDKFLDRCPVMKVFTNTHYEQKDQSFHHGLRICSLAFIICNIFVDTHVGLPSS
ncbi:hypothetical protein ACFE04_014616 [Oxalis oulophora]